jgi:hypothetical protein
LVKADGPSVGEHDLGCEEAVERQPYARPRIPIPPPSVSPAIPTDGHVPVGTARPYRKSVSISTPLRIPAPTSTRSSATVADAIELTSISRPRVDE